MTYIESMVQLAMTMPEKTKIIYSDPDFVNFDHVHYQNIACEKVSESSWNITCEGYDATIHAVGGGIGLISTMTHHMSSSEFAKLLRDLNERYIRATKNENPNLINGAFQITFGKDDNYFGDYYTSMGK